MEGLQSSAGVVLGAVVGVAQDVLAGGRVGTTGRLLPRRQISRQRRRKPRQQARKKNNQHCPSRETHAPSPPFARGFLFRREGSQPSFAVRPRMQGSTPPGAKYRSSQPAYGSGMNRIRRKAISSETGVAATREPFR